MHSCDKLEIVVVRWGKEKRQIIKIGAANQFCFDAKINDSNVLEIRLWYYNRIREKTNKEKERRDVNSFKEILTAFDVCTSILTYTPQRVNNKKNFKCKTKYEEYRKYFKCLGFGGQT
jgi:hypothetical protein